MRPRLPCEVNETPPPPPRPSLVFASLTLVRKDIYSPSLPSTMFSFSRTPEHLNHQHFFRTSLTTTRPEQEKATMSSPPTSSMGPAPAETRHVLSSPVRNLFVILFGEFCGTFMFLMLSFVGAQTAILTNNPLDDDAPLQPFSLMYIAASFGTALAVNVWIFYRISGGMFNPAVRSNISLPPPAPPPPPPPPSPLSLEFSY